MRPNSEYKDENFEKEILKAEAIKIGEKTIYPVIQVSTLEIEGIFWLETITPIALAVLDTSGKYLVPLGSEESEEYQKSEEYKIYQTLKLDEIFD